MLLFSLSNYCHNCVKIVTILTAIKVNRIHPKIFECCSHVWVVLFIISVSINVRSFDVFVRVDILNFIYSNHKLCIDVDVEFNANTILQRKHLNEK